MTKEELYDIIQHSEVSKVQFKERIDDNYKIGTSLPRNEQLFYHANFLLPYSGAGTGIIRALDEGVEMNFVNDEQIHEFIITIPLKVEVEPANEPAITENEPAFVENELANRKEELAFKLAKTENEPAFSQRPRLDNKEKDIVNFCSVPRSAQEILDRIGVTNQSRHRKKYIQSLVEKGYLSVLMSENGGTKGQRYVKKNQNKS